jgi:hypothetical protein
MGTRVYICTESNVGRNWGKRLALVVGVGCGGCYNYWYGMHG